MKFPVFLREKGGEGDTFSLAGLASEPDCNSDLVEDEDEVDN